jgi:hypothetical protein
MYISYLPASDGVSADLIRQCQTGYPDTRLEHHIVRSFTYEHEHPALVFVRDNRRQIQSKAMKFGVEVDDVCQNVCLIFLEQISKFDSSRGSLRRYIFGHLEQMLHRQTFGPLRFSLSLDDVGGRGDIIRDQVELMSSSACLDPITRGNQVAAPGEAGLRTIAEIVSGKSSIELAASRGVTKRRVNQMLKEIRETAMVQFDFEFNGEPS